MATLAVDDRGVLVTCPSCHRRNRLAYAALGAKVRCGTCKGDLALPAAPAEIASADDFDRLVARASLPVVVDFWAPWCGPCHMVAPELAKVAARRAGTLIVVKVNTDALPDLGQRLGIRSLPTLAVFSGGREAGRISGARPASEIDAFVAGAVEPRRS
jgi:thioredoxin 2